MIPNKYAQYFISFFMALFMSCIMSFVITAFNIGFVPSFALRWLNAWGFGFAAALPTIFLVAPLVRKLVGFMLLKESNEPM